MRFIVDIEPSDITSVQKVIREHKTHPIVQMRVKNNLETPIGENSREVMCQKHLMCLVTTQNKSGSVFASYEKVR